MEKYYLNLTADNKFDAGSKAVKDCYQILKENGFKNYSSYALRTIMVLYV